MHEHPPCAHVSGLWFFLPPRRLIFIATHHDPCMVCQCKEHWSVLSTSVESLRILELEVGQCHDLICPPEIRPVIRGQSQQAQEGGLLRTSH